MRPGQPVKRTVCSWNEGTVNPDFDEGEQVLYGSYLSHVSMSLLKKCAATIVALAVVVAAAGAGGGETVSGIGGGRFMGAFDRRRTARVPDIIAGCLAIGIKNG